MSAGISSRAASLLGLASTAPLAALEPFVAAQVLAWVDVDAAALLAARYGEHDPEVILAAALANRAPRHGHTAIDLSTVELRSLRAERRGAEEVEELALPADRADWVARVAASPLSRGPGAGDTPLVLRGALLYVDRYFAYEDQLRVALVRRFAEHRPVAEPALLERGLDALFGRSTEGADDRQRRAAEVALHRGLSVISGGPGTGKTWTVRNLLTLVYAQSVAAGHDTPRLALAAPTGKAAARVVESLRSGLGDHLVRAAGALPEGASVDGLRAFLEAAAPSTLHRLLGWRPDQPTRFRHDRNRPLPVDVLIVDEASMVDLALMAKLVAAVPPHARLVLLGDRHQLASVEAGSVLADLCGEGDGDVGVSDGVVFLTHSRRFGADSGIGRFASAAVEGRVGDALEVLEPWPGAGPGPMPPEGQVLDHGDIGRFEPGRRGELPGAVKRLVVQGYRPYLERLRRGPVGGEPLEALHADALKRFDRFRVLCAHRQGRLGVLGVGDTIQQALEAEGLIRAAGPWWLGRPVLVTRNDYSVGRYNGDIGLVVRDDDGAWVVAFPGEGGDVRWLAPARLPEHQTVFAMTIHKSQGSEFDDVLVVLPERVSPVLTRELVYTGVTRAKRRVSVLGSEAVLRSGLSRRVQRASGLGQALAASAD